MVKTEVIQAISLRLWIVLELVVSAPCGEEDGIDGNEGGHRE